MQSIRKEQIVPILYVGEWVFGPPKISTESSQGVLLCLHVSFLLPCFLVYPLR